MSGGVDSSAAAWLIHESGYDSEGATMLLYPDSEGLGSKGPNSEGPDSKGPDSEYIDDARDAARRIGIPFNICDFSDAFGKLVIGRFVDEYMRGATPNPCIACNRHIKFGRFLEHALNSGFDLIATGHYAQISRVNGRYLLSKGADIQKDQSYMLYTLTQDKLSRIMLPLGNLQKSDVREIARVQGFAGALRKESQDICFVPDGNYPGFIEEFCGSKPGRFIDENGCEAALKPGRFIDENGNYLGMHKGIHHYTVGQRRGLGISASHPLYVSAIDPVCNTVTLGSKENLFSKELIARDINLIATDRFDAPMRFSVKIRYSQTEQSATVWQLEDDVLRIEFDRLQRAVTKGQAAVLYDGNTVIGGGTIC